MPFWKYLIMNNNNEPGKIVNVAVVGLGFMGVTHLRAYLQTPQARVAAVCDAVRIPVNGVLAGVAGNIKKSDDINLGPEVGVYRQLDEVLSDPTIDIVDLCTPTPLHAEQAIRCLKAGKNVFCEKPMARTSAEAQMILDVAKDSPGFLMPAMCMRFWPGWSWLKQVVTDGTYGKVIAARFRRVSEMPGWSAQGTYSAGSDLGGALFDLHIHDTDFVQFLFGTPQSVFSTGAFHGAGPITHVVTHYIYPGGPAVHAEGNWLLKKGFEMAYTIYFEKATLDFDLSRGTDAMRVAEPGQDSHFIHYSTDGYLEEIRYVIGCAASGQRPQVVTAADGFSALKICEAEEKSIRSGSVVPV